MCPTRDRTQTVHNNRDREPRLIGSPIGRGVALYLCCCGRSELLQWMCTYYVQTTVSWSQRELFSECVHIMFTRLYLGLNGNYSVNVYIYYVQTAVSWSQRELFSECVHILCSDSCILVSTGIIQWMCTYIMFRRLYLGLNGKYSVKVYIYYVQTAVSWSQRELFSECVHILCSDDCILVSTGIIQWMCTYIMFIRLYLGLNGNYSVNVYIYYVQTTVSWSQRELFSECVHILCSDDCILVALGILQWMCTYYVQTAVSWSQWVLFSECVHILCSDDCILVALGILQWMCTYYVQTTVSWSQWVLFSECMHIMFRQLYLGLNGNSSVNVYILCSDDCILVALEIIQWMCTYYVQTAVSWSHWELFSECVHIMFRRLYLGPNGNFSLNVYILCSDDCILVPMGIIQWMYTYYVQMAVASSIWEFVSECVHNYVQTAVSWSKWEFISECVHIIIMFRQLYLGPNGNYSVNVYNYVQTAVSSSNWEFVSECMHIMFRRLYLGLNGNSSVNVYILCSDDCILVALEIIQWMCTYYVQTAVSWSHWELFSECVHIMFRRLYLGPNGNFSLNVYILCSDDCILVPMGIIQWMYTYYVQMAVASSIWEFVSECVHNYVQTAVSWSKWEFISECVHIIIMFRQLYLGPNGNYSVNVYNYVQTAVSSSNWEFVSECMHIMFRRLYLGPNGNSSVNVCILCSDGCILVPMGIRQWMCTYYVQTAVSWT